MINSEYKDFENTHIREGEDGDGADLMLNFQSSDSSLGMLGSNKTIHACRVPASSK